MQEGDAMKPYEYIRFDVRDHLDALLAERRRDALAGVAHRPASRASAWRRLLAVAGLALIRLGERLRGEPAAALCGTAPPLLTVASRNGSQRHD
jgi:hypothetical protein